MSSFYLFQEAAMTAENIWRDSSISIIRAMSSFRKGDGLLRHGVRRASIALNSSVVTNNGPRRPGAIK